MDKLKILIANDDGSVEAVLRTLFLGETDSHLIIAASGIDGTLEKIVTENPDMCLVYDEDGKGDTDTILRDLKVAGLKIPVIALVDPEHAEIKSHIISPGGKGVILRDSSFEVALRYAAKHTAELKRIEGQYREEKKEMVLQLLELRDARERAEEQSTNLIELAEDLSVTRETLENLNIEKNKLFSIIAHDLRSPFNVILGYTSMLANAAGTLSSDQVKEYAENANEAATAVFKLLENLLEWARLNLDRVEKIPKNIKLGGIVDNTLELLSPVAKEKDITLESSLTDEIAYVDLNMIDAVIRNLVNNAVKFTKNGGSIAIATEDLGDLIEVRVTDSGVGMDPEKAAKLFSLSGSSSTDGTRGEKGTGLGLILCKELVERNGGEIYVTSKRGEGSTFAFTLPKNAPVI